MFVEHDESYDNAVGIIQPESVKFRNGSLLASVKVLKTERAETGSTKTRRKVLSTFPSDTTYSMARKQGHPTGRMQSS